MPRKGENIRKRQDGRWEGRYIKARDFSGKAVYASVYAATYIDVKRKLNEKNQQIENGKLYDGTSKTFREILYLWLESTSIKLKPPTYANYLYMIETHILPHISSTPVSRVDSKFINNLLLQKANQGRLDGKGGLSPSYVKKISYILNAALEYGAKENLCAYIKGGVLTPPKQNKKLDVLSLAEQTRLERSIYASFNEWDIGILLSLYAGLRIGEVCGLKCDDLDFERQTIHIRHTVERIKNIDGKYGDGKTALVLCDAKTFCSDRIIPIPPLLSSRLAEIVKGGGDFLIKGKSRKHTEPRNYQYYFSKRLEQAGLRKINFHILRHTFATRCIEAGMDVKSLSEILGHSSVNITLNTYVHSSLEHKRTQLERMVIYCGQ